MCYNKDCKIEIASIIDGEKSVTNAKGKVIKTPSDCRFEYTFDRDGCTLSVKDNEVIQTRRGAQTINMTFRKGEETQCSLSSGGFSGAFPVLTEAVEHSVCSINGRFGTVEIFLLTIIYTLGEQKTEIKFSAKYKI